MVPLPALGQERNSPIIPLPAPNIPLLFRTRERDIPTIPLLSQAQEVLSGAIFGFGRAIRQAGLKLPDTRSSKKRGSAPRNGWPAVAKMSFTRTGGEWADRPVAP